jgi:integrase/recombinase XerD
VLISEAVRMYLNALIIEQRSPCTVRAAKSALKQLARFLADCGIDTLAAIDHTALTRYREDLAWRFTPKGKPLGARSQAELLGHVRAFCRYLVREERLLCDPSAKLANPKRPRRLPKAILETHEVDAMTRLPDLHTLRGYRDRVVLEVLYSSALRREEVANLTLTDIDTQTGYVQVRHGKGGKDRVVPLGKSACDLVESYLKGVRPEWPNAAKTDALFLNRWGNPMNPNAVWAIVRKYAKLANIQKPTSPHTFRHSCATLMVRNGAPIRHIQEMLGHESLETTQLYTRVTINDLREMHQRFHPREKDQED